MNTLITWVIVLYVIPTVVSALILLYEGENPFSKEHRSTVFLPIANIWFVTLYWIYAAFMLLISWVEMFYGIVHKIKI